MMKKYSLLFFIFILTLLGGNGAYAQGTADETYDFAAMAEAENGTTVTYSSTAYSGIGLTNGKYMISIGSTPINSRIADRADASRGWFMRNETGKTKGLWCRVDYGPELAICNLLKGDRVKITFIGDIQFVYANSAKVSGNYVTANQTLTSGDEFTAVNNGDIIIKGTSDGTVITKIEIYYRSTETYTFTGNSGESTAPVAANSEVDGESGFILDFINKTYGNGYFNHPENRFFVKEDGWKVNNNGLQIREGETAAYYYAFYILNLNASDMVTVNLSNPQGVSGDLAMFWSTNTGNARLSALASGTTYTMLSGGVLKILVHSSVAITSVTITPSPLRFTKLTDTYDLTTLSYTEPTLIVPSGATNISYTSLNEKIAKINPDRTDGDLMIVNTGTVTIQATATIGENTYTAAYELTVIAAEAVWDVRNGNECYFPGTNTGNPTSNNNTGKLLMRKVTSVPHITMEFGDATNNNLTMVTFRQGERAANLIDQNGWQHIWMNHITTPGYLLHPHQGTFYKFQPTISGYLTISGIRKDVGDDANTVVLVDANGDNSSNWDTDVSEGRRTMIIDNNKYYSYPIVLDLTFSGNQTTGENRIHLIGGHTYYLYANTPATRSESLSRDWQCFYLSGFKYETTFKFPLQNVVMGSSNVQAPGYHHISFDTSYTQTINGAGQQANITYSIIRKGNISNNVSIDQNTGTISGITSNDHGAIVVTATLTEEGNATSKTSYVLTLPYTTIGNGGSKHWVFNLENYNFNNGNPTGTNKMEQLEQLRNNTSDWTIKYKVRRYNSETKALEYINVPVLANALDVRGDNARYIGTTEGLLFNANASSFGTTTGVKDTDYRITGGSKVEKKVNGNWEELTDASDIDIALKTLLSYNADGAAGDCYYLTLENGNSLTIPNLKAGQYVRVKWSRYSPNKGDQITAYNVTDLNGTDMDGQSISIGAGSDVDKNGGKGYHEFKVKANGDVTFAVTQEGWINIYDIYVDDNFIPTDLKLADGESLMRKKESGNSFSHVYSHKWSDIQCQSNVSVSYSIKNNTRTGTLTPENCNVTSSGSGDDFHYYLNVGESGHGRFTLVQEGKVGDYVLDRKEIEIKVYEYDYTPQTYPRTWNMENISTATGTALSNDADSDSNYKTWTTTSETGKFKLALEPENVIAWTTKSSNGSATAINELNGLGIHPADITRRNNSIVFNNAEQSIDVSGVATQIMTVPLVPDNHTAYIRVKKGTDASVTAKYIANTTTEDQELTTVYDDGTYAVYKAAGGGNANDGNEHTIEFYLNNVSVKQVAVSIDTKTISDAGYATEARSYPVDYTMTKTLTGNDYIAYKINGVGNNMVVSTRVDYVPAGAGVMVTGNVTSQTDRPLFKTDVNRTQSDMSGNLLVGLITGVAVDQTTVDGGTTYYNYILATGGYKVTENGDIHTVTNEEVTGLGYYLLYKSGTDLGNNTTYTPTALKNNSAYLRLNSFQAIHQSLNSGSNAPTFCFFLDFNEATAIDGIPVDSSTRIRGEEGVYYTLQGVRVEHPGKGLYIYNGRKVFIK